MQLQFCDKRGTVEAQKAVGVTAPGDGVWRSDDCQKYLLSESCRGGGEIKCNAVQCNMIKNNLGVAEDDRATVRKLHRGWDEILNSSIYCQKLAQEWGWNTRMGMQCLQCNQMQCKTKNILFATKHDGAIVRNLHRRWDKMQKQMQYVCKQLCRCNANAW